MAFTKFLLLQRNPAGPFSGPALFTDGTAAAPSITFAVNQDLGFYRVSAVAIGFSSSGNASLYFQANGQISSAVGGGAIALGSAGQITLTAAGTNQNITLTPSGSGIVSIQTASATNVLRADATVGATLDLGGADRLTFSTFAAAIWNERFRVANNGNVLFGTVTDSSNGRIQLANHTAITGGIGFGTGASIYATVSGGAALQTNSSFTSIAPTGGIGYATGAGTTGTQATSKSTAVTLGKNATCGQITTHNASLAAATIVSFSVANTAVAATDTVLATHVSGGTLGAYTLNIQPGASTMTVNIRNNTAGALGEALVIGFSVIKAVTA